MLIYRRNAMMAGGKLSAKSYVQDGLVVMWDGIENAGWGVHDANATVWKDLVGNNTLTYSTNSAISWGTSFVDTYPDRYFEAASSIISTVPLTMEAVVSIKGNASNNDQILGSNGQGGITFIYAGSRSAWEIAAGYPYKWTAFGSLTKDEVYSTSCVIASDQTTYLNGVLANSTTSSSWRVSQLFKIGRSGSATSSCDARFFNVRLYSRALSAAEIAANYAVDKARFGTPTA